MVFPTIQFLIFFSIVFVVAINLKAHPKFYKPFLLLVNLYFFYQFGLRNFVILIISILVNFILLKAITNTRAIRKPIFILSLLLNVAALAFFKFANFTTNALLFMGFEIPVYEILAPVGISFYTFRVLSHLIDSYKFELTYEPNFFEFSTYVSFFPQIVAGPIQRAKEFYDSLSEPLKIEYTKGEIFTLVLSGILKKYVLSSFLWSFVDNVFDTPRAFNGIELIIGAFAYSSLIYLDFSGYSDFAIATSKLLGINIGPNFMYPYKAIDIKDFWNRWHISLSTFLKDYVYIPLGGNRKGTLRKYFNVMATFFISGLWHGAGLTFMIWGLLHGIGNIVSGWIISVREKVRSNLLKALIVIPSWIGTFVFITFAWIFFRAETIGLAFDYVENLFDFSKFSISTELSYLYRIVGVIVFTVFINVFGESFKKGFTKFFNQNGLLPLVSAGVCVYILIRLGPSLMPPFIYFSF